MQTTDAKEVKAKILDILKIRGPSLPLQIAHQLGISSLFAGAFLSELANEKALIISNTKVGGSPLYYLSGQENQLDNFSNFLSGKEKEAFMILKESKILEDRKQEPAIRVALRSIKDFAIYFLKDNEVFWRFHSVTEEQVRQLLEPLKEKKKEEPKLEVKQEAKEKPEIKEKITKKVKKEGVKQEKIQLEIKPEEIQPEKETIRTLKEKPRTDFVLKIFDFLKEQKIDIVEEREIKKKELSVVVKVDSSLGKINFLCIAKDKKTVTPDDLRIVLQKSQMVRMPALILYVQEPNKKTLEYAEKWASLLKLMKIDNNKI